MDPFAYRPRVLLAAAAVAGLLLTGCSGDDGDGEAARSATPSASPSATPTPSLGLEVLSNEETAASQVIDRFLGTVAAADVAGAYALLSERSQKAVGDQAAFAALGAELAGRLAAFAGGEVRRDYLALSPGVVVVTLSSTVTTGGQTQSTAYAVPVRLDEADGRLEVVPPADLGAAVLESPDPAAAGQPLAADAELAATVPAGSETYLSTVDGNDAPVDVQPSDGDRLRLVIAPQLSPGEHRVTFATVREDGTAIAVAGAFTTA